MNKQQRKELAALQATLNAQVSAVEALTESLQDTDKRELVGNEVVLTLAEYKVVHAFESTVSDTRSSLEGYRDDEQDKYDNMPEGLQGSDKGDTQQSIIEYLEAAIESLESIESDLANHVVTEPNSVTNDRVLLSDALCSHLEEALSHLEDADGSIDEATSA